jgi:hypothetical protein
MSLHKSGSPKKPQDFIVRNPLKDNPEKYFLNVGLEIRTKRCRRKEEVVAYLGLLPIQTFELCPNRPLVRG